MKIAVLLLALLTLPTIAHADPCEAPVSHFRAGDTFSGTIRYVGDGDSLCVGRSPDPATWIEVRLGDFDAPELGERRGEEAKAFLSEHLGEDVTCVAGGGRRGRVVSYDRVIAVCRVERGRLGDLLRAGGSPEGGR